jgi:hypothetical protein
VLAAEHLLDLGGLDLGLEIIEAAREVGGHVLAGLGPFDENGEVLGLLPERGGERDFLFETPTALEYLLRLGLVLPEIRLRRARLERAQLVGRSSGLKDSSACRTTVS